MRSPVASSNGDPTKSMCAEARYLIQWRPGQRLPYAAPRRGLEPKAGHNQALTLKTILGRILLYSFFGVGGYHGFVWRFDGQGLSLTVWAWCLGVNVVWVGCLGRSEHPTTHPTKHPDTRPRHPTKHPDTQSRHPTKHPDTRPSHPTKHPRRPTNNPNARPGHPTKRPDTRRDTRQNAQTPHPNIRNRIWNTHVLLQILILTPMGRGRCGIKVIVTPAPTPSQGR